MSKQKDTLELHLYLVQPLRYAQGETAWVWHLDTEGDPSMAPDEWIYVQPVWIDLTLLDLQKVRDKASAKLQTQEQELRAEFQRKLEKINEERAKLIALPSNLKDDPLYGNDNES